MLIANNSQSENKNLSLWFREIIATLVLAWPIILSNLSQMLINTTDVLLLGRVGPEALAASAIGIGIVITPMVFGVGLITASSPMMGKQLGEMPHSVREIRRTVRASMWAALSFTLPIMVILFFIGDIIKYAGLEPELAKNVGIFTRAFQFGLLPTMLTICLRNFFNALHRPIWNLIISTLSVIVNAVLNYGLIFGHFGLPEMGLLGAGIGSALTSLFTFIGMAIVVMTHKKFRRYSIFGRFWKFEFERFKQVWKLGFPIAMQLGFEVGVFSAAVFLMGLIGTNATAAHSVALQIASMTFMVPMGIAQAATIRVSNALGRKDEDGISKAGWSAFILGVGFMTLTAALLWIYPKELAQIYIEKDHANNEAVIILAVSFLKIAALFQIVDGMQVVGAGMLRGLHDTTWPMIYAFIGYWVFGIGIGAYLAFKTPLSGVGIWIGLSIGLAIVAVLLIGRWLGRKKLVLVTE